MNLSANFAGWSQCTQSEELRTGGVLLIAIATAIGFFVFAWRRSAKRVDKIAPKRPLLGALTAVVCIIGCLLGAVTIFVVVMFLSLMLSILPFCS